MKQGAAAPGTSAARGQATAPMADARRTPGKACVIWSIKLHINNLVAKNDSLVDMKTIFFRFVYNDSKFPGTFPIRC